MFKSLKALLALLKEVIIGSFDIIENPGEFAETLKNSVLLRIMEIYIDYAQFSDKDKMLKTFSQSFELLAPSALIINLGVIIKPVFTDPNYIEKQKTEEVYSVEKIDTSTIALKIKAEADRWIKAQMLMVDEQDMIREQLKTHINQFAAQFKLSSNAPDLTHIRNEC